MEMIDRFGLLPQSIKNLFEISSIRTTAKKSGIHKIDLSDHGGYILFGESPNIDTGIIIDMIQSQSNIYRLDGNTKLRINYQSENEQKRVAFIKTLLDRIKSKNPN